MAVEYGSEHTCVRLQKAQHKSAGEFDDGVQTWSKKQQQQLTEMTLVEKTTTKRTR